MCSPLYLDHAATAPPLPEAIAAFAESSSLEFANPGSLHEPGAQAGRSLRRSREALIQAFGADNYSLIFTGTGTEADHLGVQGLARTLQRPNKGQKILFGAAEHPAVRESALALRGEGFQVEAIPVDSAGLIQPKCLQPLLNDEVVLVAIQWANNELGGLNPIADLVQLVKQHAPRAAFHVDAVQAAGKRPETFDELGADSFAVASHKIGGVRGCAALFLREGSPKPTPFFLGGGHESGLRSGTENVAGAKSFAVAAEYRSQLIQAEPGAYFTRRKWLLDSIQKARPGILPLGPSQDSDIQGSILTLAFPGERAEPLLHQLEAKGILCGSGSACSTHGSEESPVLEAIGLDPGFRNSVLRFSVNGTESEESLHRVAQALSS
ncbi:MAG: cysteine desulfurase family protein [Planctomycetota bacterium]|nr:cysteine desulfurase family protein [Planctomycetota bacterium]MDP6941263.1 cysteine desulfurase family protein [Planctomycetota bacterium]